MCEPITLGALAIGGTILSTGAGVVGKVQEGRAAQQSAEYQAAVLRNNQVIAERSAQDALARGKLAERRKAAETKQSIGRQRAQLAANGVVVDQDSALDLTVDTAGAGKLDQLMIRSNSEREALGFRTQGAGFETDAQLADMRGRNAESASTFSSFNTVLAGGTSVASKWYQYKKERVF